MPDPIKLMRLYTDEAAYFGDRKVFGHTPHLHRRHLLDDDQSLIVELLDRESRLRAFLETLSDLEHLGPVTLEAVEVLRWPEPTPADARQETVE